MHTPSHVSPLIVVCTLLIGAALDHHANTSTTSHTLCLFHLLQQRQQQTRCSTCSLSLTLSTLTLNISRSSACTARFACSTTPLPATTTTDEYLWLLDNMSYNVFPFPSNVYPNSLPLDHRGQRSETPGHSHTPIPFYQQYQPYQPIYQPPPPASAPSHEQGMPWDAQAPQTHVHTHDSMGSGTPLHSIVSLEEDRYHSHQPDPPDGIHNRGTQQSLESRRNPKPPMLSRTRRGAASKARMTISSVTCSLRAPVLTPLSSNTSHDNSPLPSTILANTDDIKPDPKDIKSDISHVKGKKGKGRSSRKSSTHSPSSQRFTLKNSRGPLLPAPEGSSLEVNDLLILHPPSLSPSRASEPVNQYSEAPAPEGYQSRFEMYTCRVCSKTYDGKNARSVARRHLQDKHGVPLAMQQRRTRWDQGEWTERRV